MPPKGKTSSKGAGGKGKGADGDAESSGGGKQAKGGTAVKVLVMRELFFIIYCVLFIHLYYALDCLKSYYAVHIRPIQCGIAIVSRPSVCL